MTTNVTATEIQHIISQMGQYKTSIYYLEVIFWILLMLSVFIITQKLWNNMENDKHEQSNPNHKQAGGEGE